MAQIALPRHRVTQSQSVGVGSPLYQRRNAPNAGPIELIPNPAFSFPMRDPDAPAPEPAFLQAYPAGRRGSMPHMRQKSVTTLPDFTFNPAGTLKPATATPMPPSLAAAPATSPTTPSRPIHGHHKRGGSELIGGPTRPGMSLMGTSPTKAEGDLLPPNAALRPGPPAGRRGHAHRRSGAVSSHDLTSMMTPPPPKPDSAPGTPSEGTPSVLGHSVNKSMSQPSLRVNGLDEDLTARPLSRARVGFSDRVEYIRPLSTISAETDMSMSTIRCHSASNSLSSIVSGSGPNAQLARMSRPTLSTVEDEGRPSTAGAILDNFMGGSISDDVSQRKRPMSAVPSISPPTAASTTPPLSSRKRSFFSRNSDKLAHTFPISKSDPTLSQTPESPPSVPVVNKDEPVENAEKPKSASRKSSGKPRKVKTWANSIIPRKGKHSKKARSRAPTPPVETAFEVDDSDVSEDPDFVPNFDDDTTVTIVSPTESSAPARKLDTDIASWQPRPLLTRVDSDIMSPIIDLDAALGPFNTPNGSSPRNQNRGFSAHRKAMHSANGTAPSHRRTESAPELVPFEFRSLAAASAAPMADVFEEEEPEDDVLVMKKDSTTSVAGELEEPKMQVVEADGKQDGAAINWNFNNGLSIECNTKPRNTDLTEPLSPRALPQSMPSDMSLRQLHEAGIVEVVEDYEEPRTSSLTHSSDSTVTPQPSVDELKDHQPVMSVSVPLPQQSLATPDTVTSSFPSPDYHSSEISFDTPRFDTAASSVSDYPAMPSPRFGEPGPERRISVDDVPSLTSSRSTMTIAMQNPYPLASPRRPSDRSSSLYSIPSDVETRRRKRSSIVSLSRLINSSSFGERSKLSIEQRPHSEHLMEPPTKDKKKSKRLSRLMFWKSKDSSSSSHT